MSLPNLHLKVHPATSSQGRSTCQSMQYWVALIILIGIHRIGKGGLAAVSEICSKQGGLVDEIEAYDFKLKTHIGKLDVRVKFTDSGEPQVVAIKKAEYKVAIFDILCLNR